MAIFKDIEAYTQKSAVVGTEKIPISDTEFITPNQIANSGDLRVVQSNTDLAFSDENGYCVAVFYNGHIKTKNFDSAAVMSQIGDIETILASI